MCKEFGRGTSIFQPNVSSEKLGTPPDAQKQENFTIPPSQSARQIFFPFLVLVLKVEKVRKDEEQETHKPLVPKAGLEPDIDVTPFLEILNFPIDMSTHNNP